MLLSGLRTRRRFEVYDRVDRPSFNLVHTVRSTRSTDKRLMPMRFDWDGCDLGLTVGPYVHVTLVCLRVHYFMPASWKDASEKDGTQRAQHANVGGMRWKTHLSFMCNIIASSPTPQFGLEYCRPPRRG